MPTTEAEQKESDEVESLEREGVSLRWAGHRLHGASIGLRQRHDATMGTLEGRSDGEARAVMLRLVRDFREMNGELAAHLSRTSMLNLGVVEMLRKSRDGRAALMMRSAAEILVKGLANAEEEVQALKASLKQVEGQRDGFKTLLAKTNSELKASQAYDQLNKVVGQESETTATEASSTTKAVAAAEGVVAAQPPGKGRAPGRQEQQALSGGGGGGSSSSSGHGGVSTSAADGQNRSGFSSVSGLASGTGDPRADTRKRQRGASTAEAAAAGPAAASVAAAAAGAAAGMRAGAKRRKNIVVGVGDGAIPAGDGGLKETEGQKKQRKGGGGEEGLGSLGLKGDGGGLTLSQEDPGWVEPWKDGGGGGVAGGEGSDVGVGNGDAGSESDLQGVYDSDDAPSMFF